MLVVITVPQEVDIEDILAKEPNEKLTEEQRTKLLAVIRALRNQIQVEMNKAKVNLYKLPPCFGVTTDLEELWGDRPEECETCELIESCKAAYYKKHPPKKPTKKRTHSDDEYAF